MESGNCVHMPGIRAEFVSFHATFWGICREVVYLAYSTFLHQSRWHRVLCTCYAFSKRVLRAHCRTDMRPLPPISVAVQNTEDMLFVRSWGKIAGSQGHMIESNASNSIEADRRRRNKKKCCVVHTIIGWRQGILPLSLIGCYFQKYFAAKTQV